MYQIVVVLTVLVHYAFMLYLPLGGFLALRWRRTIWLHLPAAIWGALINTAHLECPLTWLERWARAKAGMVPLGPEGFVAHYVTGVLYPASWLLGVEIAVLGLVVVSWVIYGWRELRARSGAAQDTVDACGR